MILSNSEENPVLSGATADFLSGGDEQIPDLVNCFGSPLHIVFPEQAAENAAYWKREVSKAYQNTKVLYAFKACKSISLAQSFASEGAGADVSSVEEFVSAMRCGFAGSEISVTGPDKPSDLLDLAIIHRAAIHIDSETELGRVVKLQAKYGRKTGLFIRLLPPLQCGSRFGLDRQAALRCFGVLKANGYADFGLAFHLSGYSLSDRVDVLKYAVEVAREAADMGIMARAIDIGGGFPVQYLTSHSVTTYSKGSHLSEHAQIDTYPYAADLASYSQAHDIVENAMHHPACRDFIERHKVEIRLQPGRSLLDQCGITLMRVISVKPKIGGGTYAVLEGMSFSISERWFGSDFAPVPLLIPVSKAARPATDDCYLVGQSCLESDVIRNKAVCWNQSPLSGDIVCFANTAGYQMDSNESSFHQKLLPEKVAILRQTSGWKYYRDSNCNIRVRSV
tara:strand:+ start:4014 stop:5366 length:1353 start_codon:yes stop_codon:yes gene_type:complete